MLIDQRPSDTQTMLRKPLNSLEVMQDRLDDPPIGPEPQKLTRRDVDLLYDLMEVLLDLLENLQVEYIAIGQTMLGAVRSESILFTSDGIELGILVENDQSYTKLQESLSRQFKSYLSRQANQEDKRIEAQCQIQCHSDSCAQIKANKAEINLYRLFRFETVDELTRRVLTNHNEPLHNRHHQSHLANLPNTEFPLYHFHDANLILKRPHYYITMQEFHPKKQMPFGHLKLSTPNGSVGASKRVFGQDCFTHFTGVRSEDNQEKKPLTNEQYLPLQHSRKEKRIWTDHNRESLEARLSQASNPRPKTPSLSSPAGGLSRTRSLFTIQKYGSGNHEDLNLIAPAPESTMLPREPQPTKWFGYDVRKVTDGSPEAPNFNSADLRRIMESHIAKAQKKREESRNPLDLRVDLSIASAVGVPYTSLREERRFLYDEHTHPLAQVLAETLGVEDLSQLHKHEIQDKKTLLNPLLDKNTRRRFHECFDNFVTSFCIPLLHSIAITKDVFHTMSSLTSSKIVYRYQAFPCLRVVRPNEFSIGPHCDAAYGHSIGNLNFHIPLTPVYGTNALFTESHPGREDWHPLTTKSPGLGFLFDGARCLHFTLENTTDVTRVSIDFRIAIYREGYEGDAGGLCSKHIMEDRFSRAGPGYYDEASIDLGIEQTYLPGSIVAKKCAHRLLDPDLRVGFPFTKK
mmetsp:Transcript_41513/g.58416  ORF Transcript_41513/g.58416 Transcript_41513/m.58416 type:complete len:687 (-) Transcript_41513:104-2164(-)